MEILCWSLGCWSLGLLVEVRLAPSHRKTLNSYFSPYRVEVKILEHIYISFKKEDQELERWLSE